MSDSTNGLQSHWIETINRVQRDISALMTQRTWNDRIELLHRNDAFRQCESPFLAEVRGWYGVFTVMAIFRQTENGSGAYSLRSLLDSILSHPDALTNVGPMHTTFNVSDISADIELILGASENIRRYAEKVIIRADKSGYSTKAPSFRDLSECIDCLAEIAKRYLLKLTGAAMPTLQPVEQYSWMDIFRFPWIPECDDCGHSAADHSGHGSGCVGIKQSPSESSDHSAYKERARQCGCQLTWDQVFAQTGNTEIVKGEA